MSQYEIFIRELGGTYRQVGDYLIPNIELPERNYEIGKYGRIRHRHLKEHRKIQYATMILDGTLYDHLEEIDRICNERMETMVAAMKKQQGITEELKAKNQLAWVCAINNIRSCAEDTPYTGDLRIGNGLSISYVSQDASKLRGKPTDLAQESGIDESLFLALLAKLDVPKTQMEKDMSTLSAGQKKNKCAKRIV